LKFYFILSKSGCCDFAIIANPIKKKTIILILLFIFIFFNQAKKLPECINNHNLLFEKKEPVAFGQQAL
jgi:hypothetical protein